MKKNTYFFGYLFVRFAKIIALLILVGGAVAITAWTYNYFSTAKGIRYEKDVTLERKLDRLEKTADFATKEVGRITSVRDLKPILLDGSPVDLKGFEKATADVSLVEQRGIDLKERLINGLETKAAKLESELVKFLEKGAPSSPKEKLPSTSKPTPTPVSSSESYQSIFGELGDLDLRPAKSTLDQIGAVYLTLREAAEKQENRRLLNETYEEIYRLREWLPVDIKSSIPETQDEAPSTETAQAVNPYVRAQENLDFIRKSVQLVRNNVTQGWELDRRLDEAAAQLDSQRVLYRSSIAAKNALRTAWLSDVGKTLLVTLVLAFLVLVGADWLQSFFDTATRADQIQKHLERITGVSESGGH
jgi:hypothetical protein